MHVLVLILLKLQGASKTNSSVRYISYFRDGVVIFLEIYVLLQCLIDILHEFQRSF